MSHSTRPTSGKKIASGRKTDLATQNDDDELIESVPSTESTKALASPEPSPFPSSNAASHNSTMHAAPSAPSSDNETLDHPAYERSSQKLKHATLGMKIAVAAAFALEIGISAATGHTEFLGSVNLIAERFFTRPETTVGLIKEFAEGPIGKTIGTSLEFIGTPPVKRAIKVIFGVATFAALGAASGGIIPAVGLGVTIGAVALTSLRDYRSAAKMRNNLEMVKKTGEIINLKTKTASLTRGVVLDQEAKQALDKFLMPENLLVDNPKSKPGIYESIVRNIAPKKAQSFLLSNYARELKNTIFWNGLECLGAAVTGNFFDVASIMCIGTISENKHRTEHRELKTQTRNTIAADMKAIGCEGRKFKNVKEAEKAIDREKFFLKALADLKKDGTIKEGDPASLNAAVKHLAHTIGAQYDAHCRKKEEEARLAHAQKPIMERVIENSASAMSHGVMKHVAGYLNAWNPFAEHYNPEKFAKRAREERRLMQIKIDSSARLKNIAGIAPGPTQHKESTISKSMARPVDIAPSSTPTVISHHESKGSSR